uniref:Uncharacterized protein n=1 Tax=Anguilla anguilla TaxID=7936 RepID=A0A0E9PZI1_ANGAN
MTCLCVYKNKPARVNVLVFHVGGPTLSARPSPGPLFCFPASSLPFFRLPL